MCPTLIGREAELSTLEDALLSSMRGDGGVVVVGGEAGMGKTRLVGALAASAKRLGCVVLSGACSEAELSLPYLPFLEAIGNYLATADVGALQSRLGSAAEELAQLFPQMGRPAAQGGDASQAKLRLFESILMLLRDAAGARVLLLILEDLQWADPATRELLDYSTRRLRSTNVLVIATYRSDEMHRKHALLPTIQGWRRNGQVEHIQLGQLDPSQVGEMVCAIFDEASITEEFRDFLYERSEGNPFVLEELLRDALDRGDIYRTETGWDRKGVAEIKLPQTVRDAILQRLERLERAEVAVLSAASVIGRSFDVATLAAVAEVLEATAISALEASVAAQLLEEEDKALARYRFRHALTREAIYEDLIVPRRQQLHGRVADVLAARSDHFPVDVANHMLMAGRYDEAVAMCVAAADEAVERYAYRDAAELLEHAAAHVDDRVERARMLLRAADCYWNNTESANARRLLEAGIAELDGAGLHAEAVKHRLLLGRCYWELMRSDLAREQYEMVRAAFEPEGPSESLALAYMRLAGLASWDGDHATGLDLAQRAVDTAEKAGAGLVRAWSLNFLANAEVSHGRLDQGFARLEESYQASVAGGYRFQIGNAVYNAAWEATQVGLGDRLSVWYERVGTGWVSDAAPWPVYIRSLAALHRGRVVDAITHARAALQRARESGHEKMAWRGAVLLAHCLAENMRGSEALELLPLPSTRVDAQDSIYDTDARIRVHLAVGDRAAAFGEARLFAPASGAYGGPADVVAEVAEDSVWLRSFIEALPVMGEVRSSPRLAAAEGRLALLEGRVDDAYQALLRAEAEFKRGGLLLDGWHTGRALAEAEFRSGDPVAAGRRLTAIVTEAEPHGALLAARLARDTADQLGLHIAAPAPTTEATEAQRVATGERMVSVLFADVRGYTELTGTTAPADLAGRIATLQRWAAQEVARRHGIVDKFAGDAVMATFNVAGQSVDHTVQALRTGLAIIDKASLAGLPVGAAVAVGPAVVGNLTESANMSVLGHVTNLASRLQAQAEAGEVMLTEEVYGRVVDWLEGQRLSAVRVELELKGFGRPVVAYRLKSGIPAPV